MIRYAFVLGVALVASREPSCGGGPDGSPSGANAPCTRAKDCKSDLICAKGVCTAVDGSSHDGDGDGSTSRDAGDAG